MSHQIPTALDSRRVDAARLTAWPQPIVSATLVSGDASAIARRHHPLRRPLAHVPHEAVHG
jgi:hypothetical protein